jgi:hypothetical protein
MRRLLTALLSTYLVATGIAGCSTLQDDEGTPACEAGSCEEARAVSSGNQYVRYQAFTDNVAGIPGLLPANDRLHSDYRDLDEAQRRGLAAWHLFAGEGRYLQEISFASHGTINVLGFLDSRERNTRFDRYGVFNDPGCRTNTKVDQFGLVLDSCDDPYSSGLLGLRLKPNPAFNQVAWDAIGQAAGAFGDREKKFQVPGENEALHGWEVEPPYLPSLSCTICHVSAHPLNPPRDINNPQWNELAFTIGNQYFNEGAFLGKNVSRGKFVHQVLASQAPGTSDTSRVATDHIFNPGSINGIANLRYRPVFTERLKPGTHNPDAYPCDDGGGECVDTFHVLKQGDDSSGPAGGILRVFINIGTCTDQFVAASGGLFRGEKQTPISRKRLHRECSEYRDIEPRVDDILSFLKYTGPYKLQDALVGDSAASEPGIHKSMTSDPRVLDRGRMAFATNCATCHSSIQPRDPGFNTHDPATWFTEERNSFFRVAVQRPDFISANFLSDDRRYPNKLIGTHAARALATNARKGQIWEEYSSATYQQLPLIEDGGYYRPPSLINLWTSAPFLHNNELGLYNGRVDVAGRLEAFEDAINQLLSPELRRGKVRKTDHFTLASDALNLGIFKLDFPISKTAVIDKWANKKADSTTQRLIAANDYQVDQGHTFGSQLSAGDKAALVEYLKTF